MLTAVCNLYLCSWAELKGNNYKVKKSVIGLKENKTKELPRIRSYVAFCATSLYILTNKKSVPPNDLRLTQETQTIT